MFDEKLLAELEVYVSIQMIKTTNITISEDYVTVTNYMNDYKKYNNELKEFIETKLKPTFNQVLFNFIDEKGVSDSDVYKKAQIDRRHFSKIRSNPDYRPRKNTIIALSLSLELDKNETNKLLNAAGYSLSDSNTFDLIIQFCIEREIFDNYNVNQALDYFNIEPLIGLLE